MIQIFSHLKLLFMIVFQVFFPGKVIVLPLWFCMFSFKYREVPRSQAILGWTESEKQQYTTVTSHKMFFYLGVNQLSRGLEKIEYTSLVQIT